MKPINTNSTAYLIVSALYNAGFRNLQEVQTALKKFAGCRSHHFGAGYKIHRVVDYTLTWRLS